MLSRIPLLNRLDPFLVSILATVAIAALLPADGAVLDGFTLVSKLAIGLLFFLYGARLSTSEAVAGLRHWRLHAIILAATFVLFPLLGLAASVLTPWLLTDPLYLGVLYLCLLPATVQSATALVAVAGGNVPGAIVSASASNLLGIVVTPLLVSATMAVQGAGPNAYVIREILLMLLAPFLAGQLLRGHGVGALVTRYRSRFVLVDRGAILLVVYVAFSRGMNEGIWAALSAARLLGLVLVCLSLLGLVMTATWYGSRLVGFTPADRVTTLFCGSTKSLATGLPMAVVLFPGEPIGLIILPLMLFHQLQLLIGAAIAPRLLPPAPRTWPGSNAVTSATSPRNIPGLDKRP